MKYIYFLLFLIITTVFQSCEVINPDEDIPAIIKIDSVSFSTKYGEGTAMNEIIDSWVYIDENLVGTFEMPFEIPALEAGNHRLMIRSGVKLNGISGTRTINPFFENYYQDVNLEAGQTIEIKPRSSYKDNVAFVWNNRGEEDFEEGGISIDSIGGSTRIKKTNLVVIEGLYSGHIELDAGHQTYYGQSTKEFNLPKSGAANVLEIHVKNDVPFIIGLFTYLPGGSVVATDHLIVNPTDSWKKLYVNYTQIVSNTPTATGYRVYFKASLGTETKADIYIDNIKFMHFK